ncbi:Phenylacetic acid degradation operon negative regulatory protein PaaX [Candidatus Terasakiella magnetica]|uniref:Phenylacetic acid degradation operon negative regulatory protein PaaX n=1 Tax=Candidatus Terasakiella magnetica TaxID=1867952 RepID=A0A1C3RE00_9PROT|nr:phenylacetic acid degradation operon negative regulatory protein PaaX [Candidatus Terasakiella magnetica]SCA55485.1 Phenylacetic acid degradation operon negative regulatory protein PaaX [Candidatus Terasakiella magnetica]
MTNNKKIQDAIFELRDKTTLRAKSLLVTVYGDAILPHGGSVWLGSLINLVEPLGLSERMVRTAVFRLSKDEWLASNQIGRRSYYKLTEIGRRRFETAHRRIYASPHRTWNGEWLMVIVNKANLSQDIRDALRREFQWLGFGTVAPNVFAHPAADIRAVRQIIQDMDVTDDVVTMAARADRQSGNTPHRNMVHGSWDLEQLADDYNNFLEAFRPFYHALSSEGEIDPQNSFLVRTLLIHEYRRIMLRDPMLPDELLHADWPGSTAATLCANLYRLCAPSAEKHLESLLETAEGPLPDASPYFYNRFGGLVGTEEGSLETESLTL